MSATMVGGQENFFNSRRSGMAKTLLWGEDSGLVGWGVVIRDGRFPVRTPLGTQPGLGT